MQIAKFCSNNPHPDFFSKQSFTYYIYKFTPAPTISFSTYTNLTFNVMLLRHDMLTLLFLVQKELIGNATATIIRRMKAVLRSSY